MINYLKDGLMEFGISIDSHKVELFKKYIAEIIRWNKEINLTAIDDEKEIIIKHFLDSISSAKFVDYSKKKVIDMGTGCGFPGLPLKIVFPDMEITFLDSSKKKMMVLDSICKSLGISGFEIISDNIENVARNSNHREHYDLVTCRALANLSTLLEYGIPLIKESGVMVIYKGPNIVEEVDNSSIALDELKSKIKEKYDITLPYSDYKRSILVVEKIGKTSEKYPRRLGVPKKRPL
jgi:16S rRNA (guanine527-N7)-methyltransferase